MNYIPVPCPLCEGLVERETIKCTRCAVSWTSVLRMCGEGVNRTMEQIYNFTTYGDWKDAVKSIQETIELYTIADRYYRQMEQELR